MLIWLSFQFDVSVSNQSLCPIEWDITPGDQWIATVRVCRYTIRRTSLSGLAIKKLAYEIVDPKAETPEELRLAIRRAEVAALVPHVNSELLHSASEDELRSNLLQAVLRQHKCTSAIHISIQLPSQLQHPISLADLPGEST